jgi:rhodanese-related sulfurtransferase
MSTVFWCPRAVALAVALVGTACSEPAVVADASTVTPDASVAVVDASAAVVDASAAVVDASVITPDASAAVVDASVITPDASAAVVDASVINPDASAAVADASAAPPDATASPPDAPAPPPAPARLGTLTPEALAAALPTRDFRLINVHVPDAGEIPGTDVHIEYTDTAALLADLGPDRDRSALVYCLTDHMALIAGNALVAEGYRRITYLEGGMRAWVAAGYPLDGR